MHNRIREWSGRLFRLFTIVIIVLYLLVCLVPFLDPGKFWFVAVLGLGFPFLLGALILFILIWLFRRSKRWTIVLLVVLLLGWQQISVLIGVHFFVKEFRVEKTENTLRVLSWNVFRFDEQNKQAKGGVSFRNLMMDAIGMQEADILCFQEFFEPYNDSYFESNIQELYKKGYTSHFFFPSSSLFNERLKFGMAIFSKYPIVKADSLNFGNTPHSEGLMYVDLDIRGKKVRVFSVHMESSRLGNYGYFGGMEKEASVDRAKNVLRALKTAYAYRTEQAEMVNQQILASPYPVIVCGNIGDIANSYAYFKVRGRMNDAFISGGRGLGSTFRFISPTLRLDYIFTGREFDLKQYGRPILTYSDHYPVIADLQLR